MKKELHEGARLFNEGHYWEAHEAWESTWQGASGQERVYVQALILLAAALHKRWAQGRVTRRNYDKALTRLATLPENYDGVDLTHLARQVARALDDPAIRPRLPLGSSRDES